MLEKLCPGIELYLDSSDLDEIKRISDSEGFIKGFTTNPTLMRKAGVLNYIEFAKELIVVSKGKPVSLEILSEEPDDIKKEALRLAGLGNNVYVKIPIYSSLGESNSNTILELIVSGVNINVTAVFTRNQIEGILNALAKIKSPAELIISVFCGRLYDTGVNARKSLKAMIDFRNSINLSKVKFLWASPRHIYDVVDAHETGAEIITLPLDLIKKISLFGKDLEEYSAETSHQFFSDAKIAGLKIL